MAKLIKCPRCQSQIDVTSVSGGATVRCPDCGAMVRVPTGNTGNYPKVQAPVAQPAASKGDTRVRTGGRQTELFRKMANVRAPGERPSRVQMAAEERRGTMVRGRKSNSNAGLAIAGAVGGVALIGLLIFMMMNKQSQDEQRKKDIAAKNERIRQENARKIEEARRHNEEVDAEAEAAKKAKAEGKKPALQKVGGKYEAPKTFEIGARKFVQGPPTDLGVPDSLLKEYESLASSGRVADIVKDDAKWLACVIVAMLNDNEKISLNTFQAMRDICDKLKVQTESGKNPIDIEFVNSAQWRGGAHMQWAEWYGKNRSKIVGAGGAPGGGGFAAEDPDKANWPDIMQKLRAGGAFDDPTTQEGMTFGRVKAMGPGAYPHIVKFIDDADTGLGRAAVKLLNELTGRSSPLPNESNKTQIKAEWETFIKK